MIPSLLLYKIMQLFVVMVLGFLIVKARIVKSEDSLILAKISLYLLMPATIISSFNIELTEEVTSGFVLALCVAIGLHIVFLIIDFLYKRFCKGTSVERASIMYPNAGNLIIPIVSYVLGEEWVIYSCAFLVVQLVFIWTHGVQLFSDEKKLNLRKIFINVNVISIICGAILLVFGLRLPSFVGEISSSLGGMLGNVGMLIAGMTMANIDLKKMILNKRLYLVLLMRMLAVPFIVLLLLKLVLAQVEIENAQSILLISFLASITPAAATVMQFAQLYNEDADFAVSVNVATTLVSIVTMPIFVWLYFL